MNTDRAKLGKGYFPALTGVRALAAWLVFFHHFNPFPATSIGFRILNQFFAGVTIFFVLSGLLICFRYINRIELNKHWVKKYIRNRVARIYPMYLLVTVLTFVMFMVRPEYDGTGMWPALSLNSKLLVFGLNVTFLRGFFDQFKFTGVAPGWTLTVEECFYFLAPVLLLGLRVHKNRLLLYALLFTVLGVLLVYFAPHPYGFFDSLTFLFTVTFFGHCVEFLAGMALGLVLLNRAKENAGTSVYTWGGLAWICFILAAMAWLDKPEPSTTLAFASRIFLNNVVLVPGVCALFYGLIYEQSAVRRLLETNTFDLLGKASYTFYLIHLGVLSRIIDNHITSSLFLKFVIINLIAIVLFKLVEEPMHKLIAGHRKPKQLQAA